MSQMYVVFMLNRRVSFVNSAAENTNSNVSRLSIFNPDKKTLKDLPMFLKALNKFEKIRLWIADVN